MKKIKIIILYVLKYTGLFRYMRRKNRKKLRIVCYHGISLRDEHDFLPVLFMSENMFRHRMQLLSRLDYRVISLDDGVEGLKAGSLPDDAVVITFDDGWTGTFTKAVPILQEYNFPATVYITSYYAEKQVPVLNVLLKYILWKSDAAFVNLDQLEEDGLRGAADIGSAGARQELCNRILSCLEDKYPLEERYRFFEKISRLANVEWDRIKNSGIFMLAGPEMLGHYSGLDGMDMELHTHRHIFPDGSFEECRKEIMENQDRLTKWTGRVSRHFCYPSGEYDRKQIDWLKKMGVRSATTVKSQLNDSEKSLWELDRFLDGETVSDIEFEAELCGMSDLLRRMA